MATETEPERAAEAARPSLAKFDAAGRLVVNLERWATIASEAKRWRGRYKALAALVRPGDSVVEFGCGDMALQALLPEGCEYQPSDIIRRSEACLVIDLDDLSNCRLPRSYDIAVFAGVIEYVKDAAAVLAWAAGRADTVVFSYATTDDFPETDRRYFEYGWSNHWSDSDLQGLRFGSQVSGFEIDKVGRWQRQNLYRLKSGDGR